MSHANLTAKYRPQTFASAAGQDTLRAILSRAAAEDRVAPAYLFSGTRGVGKTTLARVFAKALNCEQAPTAEPCNVCERCRQITLGTAVDVVEIDGASNRGIDDVRRLKEVVGYAPMDGRYKVFIIDEAHMLSRDAFNALLKTLEEPPARVTFIMATTEPHKFPATILSRCQHYVFKRLSEAELEAHLTGILRKEEAPFDEAAVRLIARRAAGSVRDAMSLLSQVLALGGERLTEADAQRVLGLAGQELFFRLFAALGAADTLAVTGLVREMLDGGLDLGFFLRELALVWRNVFMLKQAGDAALTTLDLPEAEAKRWRDAAKDFSLTHIHAAWQMTLEGQRRVLTSLEPALALELLLLNLALLPRLLPIEQLSGGPKTPESDPASGSTGGSAGGSAGKPTPPPAPAASGRNAQAPQASPAPAAAMPEQSAPAEDFAEAEPAEIAAAFAELPPAMPGPEPAFRDSVPPWETREEAPPPSVPPLVPQDLPLTPDSAPGAHNDAPGPDNSANASANATRPADCSWDAFMRHAALREDLPPGFLPMLRAATGKFEGNALAIVPSGSFAAQRFAQTESAALVLSLVRAYYGPDARVALKPPVRTTKTPEEQKKEALAHPGVQLLMQEFNARLMP